jgi:hypothetical protein
MIHYVCTGGCGGVSDHPQVCEAKTCIKLGKPLTVCHCTDGLHKEAFEQPNVTAEEIKA